MISLITILAFFSFCALGMAMQFIVNQSFTIGGKTFAGQQSVNANGGIIQEVSLAAAAGGVLSTRTSGTAGTLTMNPGHGITTGARLDIYWAGGSCRAAVVGTVSVNSVPFTAALGTALPVATTPITAMVPTQLDIDFVGNNVQGATVYSDSMGTFCFMTAADAAETYAVVQNTVIAQAWGWFIGEGITNPFASATIAHVYVSHDDATQARTVRVGVATN